MNFNAKMYDHQLGRFWQPDVLTIIHRNASPFNFAYNNPIRLLDPTGLETLTNTGLKNKSGDTIYTGETLLDDVIVTSGVILNAAHYTYRTFVNYYEVNHRAGYSDYDIYKNVGNIFSDINDADWRLYYNPTNMRTIAYRAYVDQPAHKDQLFALDILSAPIVIAYAPEVIALASDGASEVGRVVILRKELQMRSNFN